MFGRALADMWSRSDFDYCPSLHCNNLSAPALRLTSYTYEVEPFA